MILIITAFCLFITMLAVKLWTNLSKETTLNRMISKIVTPLVVFSCLLIGFYALVSTPTSIILYILIGLTFSIFADIYLNSKSPISFLIGMFFFSLTQIFYIIAFAYVTAFYWSMIILGLGLITILVIIYKKIFYKNLSFELKIGVPVYMLLVTIMVIMAFGVFLTIPGLSSTILFIGAVLFWFSDLMIALNAFYKPIEASKWIVWSCYGTAQMLITCSLIINLIK